MTHAQATTVSPSHSWQQALRALSRRSRHVWLPLTLAAVLGSPLGAQAAPIKDSLVLLIPDNAVTTDWQVKVWLDSAEEEGIKLVTMTDSQFLALGNTAAANIAGLILPDSAHNNASDRLVNAVKSYANLGGKLMLTYDAASLTETGYFAPTRSRFSDLVGVDYTLYDTLRDRVVGLGPVVGTKERLENLGLPPGKYLPFTSASSIAGTSGATSLYAPVSTADPGATRALRAGLVERIHQRIDEQSQNIRNRQRHRLLKDTLGLQSTPQSGAVVRVKVATTAHLDRLQDDDDDRTRRHASDNDGDDDRRNVINERSTVRPKAYAISGYNYDHLNYYSYVTQGTFPGKVWLSSPDHGLVAGRRSVGSGSVLFVNMPLGYFKAIGTDSAPLHGFLNAFADEVVQMPRMSMQARGIGGLVFNWHVDDGDDLNVDVKYLLDKTKLLDSGPFSIHFTAGRDTISQGDGFGMSLDNNTQSQAMFQRVRQLPVKHQLGSHGGWNHDLYGLGANENNQATYQPWLEMNMAAVDRLKGTRSTEYSAPQGNNPTWAVQWLERNGIQGMYYVGDLGAPSVRSWRDGKRLTSALWSFPVVPQGKYATFEEFEEVGINDFTSAHWLLDLQNFVVNNRTNRLFYAHPPGARGHQGAITPVLARAKQLSAKGLFRWQTMTDIAQFNNRRLGVTWSGVSVSGVTTFTARHNTSLADMTWLLPKNKYRFPLIQAGTGTVKDDADQWIVIANGGTSLSFRAAER